MSPDHDPNEPEADLSDVESALASLVPARGAFDRDRVMYQAGRSSIPPRRSSGQRGWMGLAASFALIAVGEGALLARRPAERVVERVVVIREPAATAANPIVEVVAASPTVPRVVDLGPVDRDRLAWQVLRYGLDGLPAPGASRGDGRPASRRSLREEIGKVLDLGDHS